MLKVGGIKKTHKGVDYEAAEDLEIGDELAPSTAL